MKHGLELEFDPKECTVTDLADPKLLELLRGLEVSEESISYLLSKPPKHCRDLGESITKHCRRLNMLLEKYFREELRRDYEQNLMLKHSINVEKP